MTSPTGVLTPTSVSPGRAIRDGAVQKPPDGAPTVQPKCFRRSCGAQPARRPYRRIGRGRRNPPCDRRTRHRPPIPCDFHLTFALVEVPVYSRPDSLDEFIVTPRTLIETETVPRFTIRTEGGSTDVIGAGTDEREAARPSRRSSISSEDFFEAMGKRSQEIPAKLKQFLDEADAIDVRPDYLGSLNLKWDQPEGSPVNLGCIEPRNGEVRTAASCWKVDPDLAENYNVRTLGRPPPRKSPINTGLAATPGIQPVADGSARCCLRGGTCRLGRG